MTTKKACPSCGGEELYTARMNSTIAIGLLRRAELLPGLGITQPGELDVVVCGSCGHYSMFVTKLSIAFIRKSERWTRVT